MSIYEKTNVARALLYWAKNNNGNEVRYLEDRMYAVADGDMVILLTADSYDEAKRKANTRPQGEWIHYLGCGIGKAICSKCGQLGETKKYCGNCGAEMKGGAE